MAAELPDRARVVVIGGGAIGLSTLYHLAEIGISDAVLLERKELTCGTTWHSAAQVRTLRSTRNLTRLIKYSAELYARLEAETGQATGWTRTGSLSIATNPDRFTHIKCQAALSELFDIECRVIGAEEAGELWPLMRTDDVIGAVYSPNDGRVNPSDLSAALAKGARAKGAKIFEHTPTTGFRIEDGRVTGVKTRTGRIECEAAALCAGLWSREVAKLAALSLPLYACEHFYLLTKPIDGIEGHLPTLGDHDGHLYFRDDVGGLLVGCFEPHGKPLAVSDLPAEFSFDLLNEDWDHFEPMMLNALHRIPALETAEARTLLNGPESFTPDGSPLVGEAPGLGGLFLGCAMNSMGIASAGGIGRALAHWIAEGQPEFDLWPVDPRRFAARQCEEAVLRERIPEVLGDHYAIAFPGRELETGRNLRQSPLYQRLAAKGANFGERMGWERADWFDPAGGGERALRFGRPAWFDRVAAEHRAAREDVALFDQTSFGKLKLEGPDAEAAMQHLCANDMAVAPGRIVYSSMLNTAGGIESDLTVTRLSEIEYLLVTGTAQPVRDLHWIRSHLGPGTRVEVSDVTEDLAVLAVMGPKSRDLLATLTAAALDDEAFPYLASREIKLAGLTTRASRISYVGELGWELYLPIAEATALYDALSAAGEPYGLRDAGAFALTSLRVERGYRAWGHDVGPDDTPLEAGLGFAVKLDREVDFIGRVALQRQREAGVDRRLLFFRLDDANAFPIGDEPIRRGGAIVGQVTSAAFGHCVGTSVAMGYVRLDGAPAEEVAARDGYEIDIAGKRAAATGSLVPFFDPNGTRLKGTP